MSPAEIQAKLQKTLDRVEALRGEPHARYVFDMLMRAEQEMAGAALSMGIPAGPTRRAMMQEISQLLEVSGTAAEKDDPPEITLKPVLDDAGQRMIATMGMPFARAVLQTLMETMRWASEHRPPSVCPVAASIDAAELLRDLASVIEEFAAGSLKAVPLPPIEVNEQTVTEAHAKAAEARAVFPRAPGNYYKTCRWKRRDVDGGDLVTHVDMGIPDDGSTIVSFTVTRSAPLPLCKCEHCQSCARTSAAVCIGWIEPVMPQHALFIPEFNAWTLLYDLAKFNPPASASPAQEATP